jgi:hypothetical protein
MSRTGFAILIGSILFPLLQVPGVAAAPPPSGTISCDNHSSVTVGTIVPPLPAQTPSTRVSTERLDGIVNGCDLSGVTGGKTTILEGFVSLRATLPPGSSCATEYTPSTETSHVVLRSATVKITWHGEIVDAGGRRHSVRIGSSFAKIASTAVVQDPIYAIDMVSVPIGRGAFAGQVIRLELGLYNLGDLFNECTSPTGSVSQLQFEPMVVSVAPPGP